jgi:putative ABC transport system permease protein
MIRFLFIGLIRDRSRSTLPILVVAIGVALTVFMHAYITGVMHQMIETTANFTTGHVSVMTKPYAANSHLKPNDLALLGSNALQDSLHNVFPNCIWVERINFGGILDVPDAHGETKTQGPVVGIGLDLLSPHSTEIERLQLTKAILHGVLPQKQGEILISDLFAQKLRVAVGDTVTLMSTSMHGSMAFYNFTIAGTLIFGNPLLDRGTIMVIFSIRV